MTRKQIRSTLKTYFAWWGETRVRRVLRLTLKHGVLCGPAFSMDGKGSPVVYAFVTVWKPGMDESKAVEEIAGPVGRSYRFCARRVYSLTLPREKKPPGLPKYLDALEAADDSDVVAACRQVLSKGKKANCRSRKA